MEDSQIIELYWRRSEDAIMETEKKYGKYCHYIAYNILRSREDAKECVNDTYFNTWKVIPPNRPNRLSVFLGKITRNLSLNKYKQIKTKKRGHGQVALVLDELQECIPARERLEDIVEGIVIEEVINGFLAGLSREARNIFLRRYWFFSSVKEIAADFSISESKVKVSLMRSRNLLKEMLQKEGIYV